MILLFVSDANVDVNSNVERLLSNNPPNIVKDPPFKLIVPPAVAFKLPLIAT
jgi:hypothetical protein